MKIISIKDNSKVEKITYKDLYYIPPTIDICLSSTPNCKLKKYIIFF